MLPGAREDCVRRARGGDAEAYRDGVARGVFPLGTMDPDAEQARAALLEQRAPLRAEAPRLLYQGDLFEVYEARVGGAVVALKRVRARPRLLHRLAIGYAKDNASASDVLRPDIPYSSRAHRLMLERLLWAEARVVEDAGRAWNHGLIGVMRWSTDGALEPLSSDETLALGADGPVGVTPEAHLDAVMRWADPGWAAHANGRATERDKRAGSGALCLVMPRWEGAALSAYPRRVQRRLYPSLLPSLWDALAVSAHRDLSSRSVVLAPDLKRFRLVGPGGVVHDRGRMPYHALVSLPLGARPGRLSLCATHLKRYPLVSPLMPYRTPTWPALKDALCRGELDCSGAAEWSGAPEPARPCVADMIAAGLIYAEILTGGRLYARMEQLREGPVMWPDDVSSELINLALLAAGPTASEAPSWRAAHAAWLAEGLEATLLEGGEVLSCEAALCARLVRGDVRTREELVMRLVEVMEHHRAHLRVT